MPPLVRTTLLSMAAIRWAENVTDVKLNAHDNGDGDWSVSVVYTKDGIKYGGNTIWLSSDNISAKVEHDIEKAYVHFVGLGLAIYRPSEIQSVRRTSMCPNGCRVEHCPVGDLRSKMYCIAEEMIKEANALPKQYQMYQEGTILLEQFAQRLKEL